MESTEDVGLDSKLPQENETVEYSITLNRVYIIGESMISLESNKFFQKIHFVSCT